MNTNLYIFGDNYEKEAYITNNHLLYKYLFITLSKRCYNSYSYLLTYQTINYISTGVTIINYSILLLLMTFLKLCLLLDLRKYLLSIYASKT